ncbi:MAG: hypothetical protein KBT12_03895 [Bacteroidales bacterium]|nr:hypothetical protein [Candidatus Physcousia equi]
MKNKVFIAILAFFCLVMIALGIYGYNLYNESIAIKDLEKIKQEKNTIDVEADEAELKRIKAERESSLEEELNTSLAREKATDEEFEQMTSYINQNRVESGSLLASLRGTWEGGGTVDGAYVVLTVMAFDGSSGWAYTSYKGRTIWNPGTLTVKSMGNNEYGVYNDGDLFAKYTNNGNLIDKNGVTMKKVSNDVPSEPFTIKVYFSNTFCKMGEYGIEEQYVYKHLIEQREGVRTGNTTFRIFSREKNVLLWEYDCGRAQNSRTDRVRRAIDVQFLGKETHSGEQSKVTLETDYSNGNIQIYTSSTNSDFLMYNCTLMEF